MKLWLDNEKPAPAGWVWIKTEIDLASILNAQVGLVHSTASGDITVEEITAISLDYELDPGCGDGKRCAEMLAKGARDWTWSVKNNQNPGAERFLGIQPMLVLVHSFSRDAKKEMEAIIKIAQDQWVIGLTHLSVIALADIRDAKFKEKK